jgi:hypothetical protein
LDIMDSKMTDEKSSAAGVPGQNLIPRFLLWLGASTGAIGVVLSALGFLVEHAYFDRLGLPRTLYQATSHEYAVSGGKFLLGIVPMAVTGALQFCIDYWWLALGAVLLGGLAWWKSFSSNVRWLAAAIWLAVSLAFLAARFEWRTADYGGVAMFTFVVLAAIGFVYFEVFFADRAAPSARSVLMYASRIPFAAILTCALVALPYLRGYYAQQRVYPVVQFLSKDQIYFCALSGAGNAQDPSACGQESWQIIDIGAERGVVRRVLDSQIYVVPASSITTFRILGKDQNP